MKPVSLEQFQQFRYLSNPTFSPNGKNLCFTVTEADPSSNGYRSFLYMKKGGKTVRLTNGGKERSFCFLDDTTILFPSDREQNTDAADGSRFYRISLQGGEAELAFELPVHASKAIPLKDGNFLVTASTIPGFEDLYRGDKKTLDAYKTYRKENEDYEEITQTPWWWNGSTYTKGAYESLFLYQSKKKTLRRLTERNESVSRVEVSKDGKTVYFLCTEVVPCLKMGGTTRLCCMKLDGKERRTIAASTPEFEVANFRLADSFLLLIAHTNTYGRNTDPDFYRVDYKSDEVTLLAKHGEAIGSSVGSDIRMGGGNTLVMDGDRAYFISTRFDSANLYCLENGTITQLTEREGSVDSFDVKDGKLVLCALFDMKGQELYDGEGRQLTKFNEKVLKNTYVAQPEKLNVTVGDHDIHGFVLRPMNAKAGEKAPVILDIHGGPKTVYGPVFYHEMQYWAGLGYYVIFCNPTGSDGRGEFMDIRGKYGTVEYEDIMAFCDAALQAYPEMDEENFFETGGSYGGFMTNWIIGHTDRFRACASQRSISNWFSFYGVSDIGPEFCSDQNQSDPWDDPEKLWWHSPLRYADKVKTPTLFLHSFEDYRCPIDQGYQMFNALIQHGVESKLVCFRGENHDLSRTGKPAHRIKRLREITRWFEDHRK